MRAGNLKRKRWSWYFYDWASQPYNTLLLTFIFAPYIKVLMGDGAEAQATWGFAVGAAGVVMAILAPILGAIADSSGARVKWVWGFSIMYVVGASFLWLAAPGASELTLILFFFCLGLVGFEFATVFTNSMLPELGSEDRLGRISGNGWAIGYVGGFIALVLFLGFFADNAQTGKTLFGFDPLFGLDASEREGTRFVGPFSAIWYVVFMIPFAIYMRDDPKSGRRGPSVGTALAGLWQTLKALPSERSMLSYLVSSMLYRDGLAGIWVFGGIYAAGVLNWGIQETGLFGIIAIVFSALFSWLGGKADDAIGTKPVIIVGLLVLIAATITVIFINPTQVLFLTVEDGSALPTQVFTGLGAVIGAAAGAVQAASRTMLVRLGDPARLTEAFGLYALSGKATSFIAPLSIGVVTAATGSQQLGILPIVGLLLVGLLLLVPVRPRS